MPVHVGVSIDPKKSSIHRHGTKVHNVLKNPIGNANKNAQKPNKAQSLIAFSKFSPLYPPI